jgi:hypothetical protein
MAQTPQGLYDGFPKIWGISGTSREQSVGNRDQQIFYVNADHAAASDRNYGLDPDAPVAAIQELVNRSAGTSDIVSPAPRKFDIIYVGGNVREDVVIPRGAAQYIQLIGVGHPGTPYQPAWIGVAAGTPSLEIGTWGWRVSNFKFNPKAGAAAVYLRYAGGLATDAVAHVTTIDHCLFDGGTTGRYGIASGGAFDVWITDNIFQTFNNAVAGGAIPLVQVLDGGIAIPMRNRILRNQFLESQNGVYFPCNSSIIADNIFQPNGLAYNMTIVLHTNDGAGAGTNNIVTRNVLPGDYSIGGGQYQGDATDVWSGNFATDIAEAEVADNGFTILPPA